MIGLRWCSRVVLPAMIAGSFLCAAAIPARAHAVLATSDPADGATLSSAPNQVVLEFSEPIDDAASSVKVLDTNGGSVGGEIATPSSDVLTVPLESPGKGVYIVTWRVLSTVDGHVTAGTLAFGVGVSPGDVERPSEVDEGPGATPLGVASRGAFYLGVILLLGVGLTCWFAFRGEARFPLLLSVGWACAVLGSIGIAESQRADVQVSIGAALQTSIGRGLLWRLAPLAAVGLALAYGWRHRLTRILVPAGSGIAVAAHVALGHAAANGPTVSVAAQSIHVVAVSIWIGGLVSLLVASRTMDRAAWGDAVRRFSLLAGFALATVVATGAWRALEETRSWRALTGTTFGRLVLAKLALLGVLAILGAINRYRHVPRAETRSSGLRRLGAVELVVAGLVLALTGFMASVAPARTAIQDEETSKGSVVATGTDFARTVQATLTVSPGRPGPNEFSLDIIDTPTGVATEARRVTIDLAYVGRSEFGTSIVEMAQQPDGAYLGTGSQVGVGGVWSATVLVERETSSTQIPIWFGTVSDLESTPLTTPGQPTIYDVALSQGGSVQFYVDPPGAGFAEVHATFFDEQGGERGDLTDIRLVASSPDGDEPTVVPVRVLSPGHFVGNLELSEGTWRFDTTAMTPEGDLIWAPFDETITRRDG